MLEIEKALDIICGKITSLSPTIHPISTSILGQRIAENIVADTDSPPFTKALMDGYAVRARDITAGKEVSLCQKEILAGVEPGTFLPQHTAYPIMTGAPIPEGADAVIPLEFSKRSATHVSFTTPEIKDGWFVLPQGHEFKKKDVLLKVNTQITSRNIGILAACGKTAAMFYPGPKAAIVSTGTELVEPNQVPTPGKIRNTNANMLSSLVSEWGGVPKYLGRGSDCERELQQLFLEGLEADLLIISGGVSAGKMDLVPSILKNIGVNILFHKINMKPGKPMLFGISGQGKPVFGLPGNPVSAFVCFHLFIRPALETMRGKKFLRDTLLGALTQKLDYQTDRPTLHPGFLKIGECVTVTPTLWFGSADLLSLSKSNSLIYLPNGSVSLEEGTKVECIPTLNPLFLE